MTRFQPTIYRYPGASGCIKENPKQGVSLAELKSRLLPGVNMVRKYSSTPVLSISLGELGLTMAEKKALLRTVCFIDNHRTMVTSTSQLDDFKLEVFHDGAVYIVDSSKVRSDERSNQRDIRNSVRIGSLPVSEVVVATKLASGLSPIKIIGPDNNNFKSVVNKIGRAISEKIETENKVGYVTQSTTSPEAARSLMSKLVAA